jgi:hypothetical protein
LGIIATRFKSDLEIPPNSSKFISLYLLFSIGFKGGQELAHSNFNLEIIWSALFGVFIALVIPIYCFFILKRKFNIENSGAIAAAYGSVSAVTFVTAVAFLEIQKYSFSGHMVAIMALMEAPAIIVGVILMRLFHKKESAVVTTKLSAVIRHSFTNGSVMLILGCLIIGYLASDQQAMGIKPFTTDIFKGFLAIFLLDMGIVSGKKLDIFFKSGWFQKHLYTIAQGQSQDKTISVCGEMAGDPSLTRLLLGMGLRSFSMHPTQILAVKQVVLRSDTSRLKPWAQKVLASDNPAELMASA